jgi:hypothetical protein
MDSTARFVFESWSGAFVMDWFEDLSDRRDLLTTNKPDLTAARGGVFVSLYGSLV